MSDQPEATRVPSAKETTAQTIQLTEEQDKLTTIIETLTKLQEKTDTLLTQIEKDAHEQDFEKDAHEQDLRIQALEMLIERLRKS